MISINVQAETPELLAAHVAWLHAKLGGAEVIAEVKAKRTAKEAIDKASTKPEAEIPATVEIQQVIAPAPAVEAPSITLEEVRAKLTAISQAGKKSEVKALIAEYGCTSVTALPAEKFSEILEKAEALA